MPITLLLLSLFAAALIGGEGADEPGLWFRSDPGAAGWSQAGWREPWNQHRHISLAADEAGAQVMAIAVDAKAEANLPVVPGTAKMGLQLDSRWVYEIAFAARAVGQIEGVRLLLRRRSNPYTLAGDDSFPVSKEWTVFTTQIRPRTADDDSELILVLKGVGTYQVRWLSVTRRAAFRLPDGAATAPPRGELLANADFALGASGWHYNTPGWGGHTERYFATAPAERPGFVDAGDGRTAFRAAAGIFGFLTWSDPLQLRLGRRYRVRVSGQGANDDAFVWIARPGQNIDIIRKLPLTFVNGVAEGVYHHAVPEHGTLSERAQDVYVRVEHFGKAPLELRSISLIECEADAAEAPPVSTARTAVTITGLDPGMRAVARPGQRLLAQVRAIGLTADATLELTSAGETTPRRIPVKLQSAPGGAQADVELPALPPGWYEARLIAPGAVSLADRFAIVPVRPPGLKPRPFLGVHMPSEDPRHIPFLADLGLGHARCFEFGWPTVEPQAGSDRFPTAILARYHHAGVAPMIILNGTPSWSTSAPQAVRDDPNRKSWDQDHWSHYAPASDEAWEGYVRGVVRRGKAAGVDAYEIWNEPNGYFMRHNPERDPSQEAAYVRLARTAYRAVKAEDPAAIVVAGATAGQAMEFFRKAFALGLAEHCDAISYHAYGEVGREMLGAAAFAPTIRDYRALMARHGGEKPIWDSESGTSIAEGIAGLDGALTLIQGLVAREAAGLARYYIYSAGPKHFPLHSNFNMVTGFADRPLVSAPLLAVYARLLDDAAYARTLVANEGVQLYEFARADGSLVRIGWSVRGMAPVTVPGLGGTLLDAFGRRLGEIADGTVELGQRPRWIVSAADLGRLTAP